MRTGAIMSTTKRASSSVKLAKPTIQRKSQKLLSPQIGVPLRDKEHHLDFWDDIKCSLKLIDTDIINENIGMPKIEAVMLNDKLNLIQSSKISYLVDPTCTQKICWDLFIGALILYSIVTIPFYYSFSLTSNDYLDYIIDFFFFADIVLTFNTALLDKNSNLLISDRKIIAIEYLKFWFWIDLSSTIPLDTLFNVLLTTINGSTVTSIARLVKIIRLLRLFKIIRVLKLNKLYESLEEANFNPSFIDAQALLLKILFVSHLVACFWYLMSTVSNDDTSWVKKFSLNEASITDKYIAAFYWTTTTLLSIGYGDIYAVNNNERIYAICTQIFGGIIFGAVIAQVTQIFDKMNPTAKAYKDRMDELNAYLEEKPLPMALTIASKEAYSYYLRHKSCFNEKNILCELPDNLRDILVRDIYGTEINRIFLFRILEKNLVVSLMIHLKPFKATTGTILAGKGNVVSEIVFILRGVVQFSLSSGITTAVLGYDTNGGYFGVFGYYKRTLSVGQHEALSNCELMSLDVRHLDISLSEYPEESLQLLHEIELRYNNFLISKNSEDVQLVDGTLRKKELLIDGFITSEDHLPDRIVGVLKHDIRIPFAMKEFIDRSHGRLSHSLRIEPITTRRTSPINVNINANRPTSATAAVSVSGESRNTVRNSNTSNQPEIDFEHLNTIKNHLIHPKGSKKRYWDILIGLLIVFSVLSAPYQIAFIESVSSGMFWVSAAIDMTFMVDMLVTSRTCYYDSKDDILITNVHLIRRRYFKRWFWIDLFSSFPIDFILSFVGNGSSTASYANNIFKVFRLTRLLKMIRLLKIDRLLIQLEEKLGMSSRGFQLIKLLAQVLLIGHFVACLWWFLGDIMSSEAWFDNYSYRDKPVMDRYVLSLYWTFTTLSTVGYGDIVAGNSAERVVNILIELIGASLFGYVVANVSSIVSSIDASADKIKRHVEEVKHYLLEKQSLHSISKIILKHSKQQFTYMSVFDEVTILEGLPENIIKKIISIRHKNTIRQICIFRYITNRSIILHIFRRMMPHFFDASHFIVRQGDEAKTIHFLVVGQAQELIPLFTNPFIDGHRSSRVAATNNNKMSRRTSFTLFLEEEKKLRSKTNDFKVIGEFKTGDFFGYKSMINRTSNMTAIRAMTSCTTYSLSLHEITLLSEDAKAIGFSLRNAFAKCIHKQSKEITKKKKRTIRINFMSFLKKKYLDAFRSGTNVTNKKSILPTILSSSTKSILPSTGKLSKLNNGSYRFRVNSRHGSILGKPLMSRSQNSTKVCAEEVEEEKTSGTAGSADDGRSCEEVDDRRSRHSSTLLDNTPRGNRKVSNSTVPLISSPLATPRKRVERGASAPYPIATAYENSKLAKYPIRSKWDIVRIAVLQQYGDYSNSNVIEWKRSWSELLRQRITDDPTFSSSSNGNLERPTTFNNQKSSINVPAIQQVGRKLRLVFEESKFDYDSDDDSYKRNPLCRMKRELRSIARRNSAPSLLHEKEEEEDGIHANLTPTIKRCQSFTSMEFFTNQHKLNYKTNPLVVM